MELSTLSFPHTLQSIPRHDDSISRVAGKTKCRNQPVNVAFPSIKNEGLGLGTQCRKLGLSNCGLDRRRRTVANCSVNSSPGSVHFVGIGGSGLSALALLALQQGWRVSGSDLEWSEGMERLREAGARVYAGHDAGRMMADGPVDAVVVSSAVGARNEEVDAAGAMGVPIYKRDAWLGKITEGYELIAVAGTHGKSTTTAMLSVVLRTLGEDITAIVGAQVPQFPDGGNAMFGTGRKFVLEADEYDGCFLGISPSLAVVTNVEWEHVDMFPDEEAVRDIFKRFVMRIKPGGQLVICDDSCVLQCWRQIFIRIDERRR